MGHAESEYPEGVNLFPTTPPIGDIFLRDEIAQYQSYQQVLEFFDVIHDFSHQHLVARNRVNLPTLNIFWHDPGVALFPKAPYNIIALSEWAAQRFKRFYKQDAKYQQSIIIDTEIYRPWGRRNNRFLSLGVIHPRKGHLEALAYCKEAGVPLDIVGKLSEDTRYCGLIKKSGCYLGEVSDEEKLILYQSCRALIYPSQEAEVTNHKLQEAMLCGAPVIVSNIGAMPEIVTHGVDGFLCKNKAEFVGAIKKVEELTPDATRASVVQKYGVKGVIEGYMPLYEKVRAGFRW